MDNERNNSGFVLTGVLMLVMICALITGSMVFSARQSGVRVRNWQNYDAALLAAQTAIEKIKSDIYMDFREEYAKTYDWSNIYWLKDHAGDSAVNGTLASIIGIPAADLDYGDAQIRSSVTTSDVVGSFDEQKIFVTTTVEAEVGGVTRKFRETVCYTLNKSNVFDHSYFINNFGWFSGVDLVMNGDIRSNYNIDLNSSSLVLNGNASAAGRNIMRRNPGAWNWNTYKNNSNSEWFRPASHVDMNRNNDDSAWEQGYDAYNIQRQDDQLEMEMPYIGNLADYRHYAREKGGSVRIGGSTVIDSVYDGAGPSGVDDAPDEGSIVLLGTWSNPIEIDGPVVVNQDLIIGGYYTGQGTIYAGRNVHIIDDLVAKDPPEWNHPESVADFQNTTLPDNLTKDFLGLCAKGSTVLGDYNHSSFSGGLTSYLKPPFTKEYEVSSTDSFIGYVTGTNADGDPVFNGDYTAFSGQKADGSARRYYESSLSDAFFNSFNPLRRIGQIDAVLYNNHLTAGYLDRDALINGGIICRDEALVLNGRLYMNWDPRVALEGSFRPFLPMELRPAETIVWTELAP
jgi:hypothetical protein